MIFLTVCAVIRYKCTKTHNSSQWHDMTHWKQQNTDIHDDNFCSTSLKCQLSGGVRILTRHFNIDRQTDKNWNIHVFHSQMNADIWQNLLSRSFLHSLRCMDSRRELWMQACGVPHHWFHTIMSFLVSLFMPYSPWHISLKGLKNYELRDELIVMCIITWPRDQHIALQLMYVINWPNDVWSVLPRQCKLAML